MSPMDAYQQRASECLERAETSNSFDERRTWRELALCWLRLSDHAERLRHRTAGSSTAPAARRAA